VRIGVCYFPTDYGIDIRELAREAEARGFDSLMVLSTRTFQSPAAPRIPAAESCPNVIPIRMTRSLPCRLPPP